jgi:hypothetical protein
MVVDKLLREDSQRAGDGVEGAEIGRFESAFCERGLESFNRGAPRPLRLCWEREAVLIQNLNRAYRYSAIIWHSRSNQPGVDTLHPIILHPLLVSVGHQYR